MIRLQLDQLATLVALVDEGTFDKAARRLGVTPSAVSQRVKAMESQLGQIVLDRTTPVSTTPAGATLLTYARRFALLAADAERAIGEIGASPTLAVAVNADSLATWFVDALAEAERRVPVAFEIHRDDQDHTAEMLRSGIVAAAVTSSKAAVQGCTSTRLGVVRYLAVCSPRFAERHFTGAPTRSSLAGAPVVLFDRKDELQDRFHAETQGAGRRHYIPSSVEFATAIRLGLGWGVLPEQQCSELLKSGELVSVAGGDPVDVELYWQAWNLKSATLDAVTEAVVRTARGALRR
ncbi:LysR family transcriptional regulator ArgP [Herbiconiux sp. L3-i23]|uniref:LysR family transcriptional regulator ArgP n=1 Tax=Herbiconiux sp. L3-i23 TaxID=2905871 RepID=UPI00206B0EB0|nr:LysR family transcriptional regulator ArgP [Herbiconiux sp. L3-i23]BDI22016.1 transcriptional regulator ArgP [Herbiconiux sp. L3-i23]